jgi:hypothetical protein
MNDKITQYSNEGNIIIEGQPKSIIFCSEE